MSVLLFLSSSVLLTHLYHGDSSTSCFHVSIERKNKLWDITKPKSMKLTWVSQSVLIMVNNKNMFKYLFCSRAQSPENSATRLF